MHFSTVALALSFSSAALAFPALFKRQDPITVESIVISTTQAVVGTATEDSPFPSASATGSADIDYSDYPCPEGYLLTYQEAQRTYDTSYITLRDAGLMAGSWSSSPQYQTGDDNDDDDQSDADAAEEPGTERSSSSPVFNEDIDETLIETDTSEEAYSAVSNLTSLLTVTDDTVAGGELVLTNWSYVYQVYSNNTASESRTTVKLFANACANDQPAAREALALLFEQSFDNVNSQVDDAEPDSVVASRTFVASVAPPVITDTSFATITEQNTDTLASTETLVDVLTETDTNVSFVTDTAVVQETLANPTTETESFTATETAIATSTFVETDTAQVTQTLQATVTEQNTVVQTPIIDQVTSQVVVPSVVTTA